MGDIAVGAPKKLEAGARSSLASRVGCVIRPGHGPRKIHLAKSAPRALGARKELAPHELADVVVVWHAVVEDAVVVECGFAAQEG